MTVERIDVDVDYGNVPLLPSTGIFVSRIHTEIIFRVGLEFNKKKIIIDLRGMIEKFVSFSDTEKSTDFK